MRKAITPKIWNKLSNKEKLRRVEEFDKHFQEYDRLGIPYGMNDLRRLAIKHQCPIPTGFDKQNLPLYEGFE